MSKNFYEINRKCWRRWGSDPDIPVIARGKWPLSLLMDYTIHVPRTVSRITVCHAADHSVNNGVNFGVRKFINHFITPLQFHNPHVLVKSQSFLEPPVVRKLWRPFITVEMADEQSRRVIVPDFEVERHNWVALTLLQSRWYELLTSPDGESMSPEEAFDAAKKGLSDEDIAAAVALDPLDCEEGSGAALQRLEHFSYDALKASLQGQFPYSSAEAEKAARDADQELVTKGVVDQDEAWAHYQKLLAERRRGHITDDDVAEGMTLFKWNAAKAAGLPVPAPGDPEFTHELGSDRRQRRAAEVLESVSATDPASNRDRWSLPPATVATEGEPLLLYGQHRDTHLPDSRPLSRHQFHRAVAEAVLNSVVDCAMEMDDAVAPDVRARIEATPPRVAGPGQTWVQWDADASYVADAAFKRRATIVESAQRRYGAFADIASSPHVSDKAHAKHQKAVRFPTPVTTGPTGIHNWTVQNAEHASRRTRTLY